MIDSPKPVTPKSLLLTIMLYCYIQPHLLSFLISLPGLIILTYIPSCFNWSVCFSLYPHIISFHLSSPNYCSRFSSVITFFWKTFLNFSFFQARLGSACLSCSQNILSVMFVTALVTILCVYLPYYSLSKCLLKVLKKNYCSRPTD